MASFRRMGRNCPLRNRGGFYSFVEDWNRNHDAEGYLTRRCAVFTSPQLEYGGNCKLLKERNSHCGEECASSKKSREALKLTNPCFTKVITGSDAFAEQTANAKMNYVKGKFYLETGGTPQFKNDGSK